MKFKFFDMFITKKVISTSKYFYSTRMKILYILDLKNHDYEHIYGDGLNAYHNSFNELQLQNFFYFHY